MAITLQEYRSAFPEHSAVSDAAVNFAIDRANTEIGDEFLGARTVLAQKYYAAHFVQADAVASASDPAATGPVSSMSAGEMSVSFAVATPAAASKDDFQSTKYGQRYVQIISRGIGMVYL